MNRPKPVREVYAGLDFAVGEEIAAGEPIQAAAAIVNLLAGNPLTQLDALAMKGVIFLSEIFPRARVDLLVARNEQMLLEKTTTDAVEACGWMLRAMRGGGRIRIGAGRPSRSLEQGRRNVHRQWPGALLELQSIQGK